MIIKRCAVNYLCYFSIAIGVLLTAINVYGLTQNIRPEGLFETDLRFNNDITLNHQQALQSIKRDNPEDEFEYVKRLSEVISNSIAHIHWEKESDTHRFHQLIPIWENYFLYFMGRFSGISEFEKYHFANYERSLERGIGICGDASMIMSQILNKQGIKNQIISFPGHVVLAVQHSDGSEIMYDPDFGVTIPHSIDTVQHTPSLVNQYYLQRGYFESDINFFKIEYAKEFERWNGVIHFITKKHYFEQATYLLKWPLPLLMIFIAMFILRTKKIELLKLTLPNK